MRSQTYAVFTVKKKMHPAMTRRHLRRWKRAPRRGRRRTRPDEALPRPRSGSLHQLRRPRKAVKPDFALEPVTTACVRGGISPTDLDHGIWQWLADDDLDWLIMTLGHHWCRNRVPSLCAPKEGGYPKRTGSNVWSFRPGQRRQTGFLSPPVNRHLGGAETSRKETARESQENRGDSHRRRRAWRCRARARRGFGPG